MKKKEVLLCVVCKVESAPKDHLCPVHRKMSDSGFVALVEVTNGNKDLKPADALYTGRYMHMARQVFYTIFTDAKPEAEVCFVSVGTIDKLTAMYEAEHGKVPKIGG